MNGEESTLPTIHASVALMASMALGETLEPVTDGDANAVPPQEPAELDPACGGRRVTDMARRLS